MQRFTIDHQLHIYCVNCSVKSRQTGSKHKIKIYSQGILVLWEFQRKETFRLTRLYNDCNFFQIRMQKKYIYCNLRYPELL